MCLPNSPHLNPVDYRIMWSPTGMCFEKPVRYADELKQLIQAAADADL